MTPVVLMAGGGGACEQAIKDWKARIRAVEAI